MYMQKLQYDYQLQQSVAVRRFKHDLVNHIGVLRELMNEKKTEEAKEYIDTIWNIQDEFDLKIHTGDSILDVIVNYSVIKIFHFKSIPIVVEKNS